MSDSQRGPGGGQRAGPTVGTLAGADLPIEVCYLDDNGSPGDIVDETLGADDRFVVERVTTVDTARDRVGTADCVVSTVADGRGGHDLYDAVRAHSETLPVVFFTVVGADEVPEELLDDRWTAYVKKSGLDSFDLLAATVSQLVGFSRLAGVATRGLAALDAARDGIAVVDQDGAVTFANSVYARQAGVDRDAILGSHWTERYTDDEVDRLQSNALPTVEDAWRWTGECDVRRPDGSAVSLVTRIVGQPDGSLIIVHEGESGQ